MWIKVIRDYNSTVLNRLVRKDEELEVDAERGEVLINAKMAKPIIKKSRKTKNGQT